MGLFIDVCDLAGDCIVQGQVRRCAYSGGGTHTNGTLTIHGLTLADAMSVLKALGSDSVATASLNGVLPAVQPAAQAPVVAGPNPQTEAARKAGWRSADEVLAEHAARTPTAPVQAPAPQVPAAAPQQALPGVGAPAPVQPPPPAPAAPADAPAAPQQAPAEPAADAVPDDVLHAATLRPVVGWLHEQQGVEGTVDAMYPRVRDLIGRMSKSSPLARIGDDDLKARIKSTLERLAILKG